MRNAAKKTDVAANLPADRVELPFILVSTNQETVVFKNIETTKDSIFLDFSAPFQIHDDTEVLKQLDLHKAPREKLASLIPAELIQFLPDEDSGVAANRN
jgi:hypothetical protein